MYLLLEDWSRGGRVGQRDRGAREGHRGQEGEGCYRRGYKHCRIQDSWFWQEACAVVYI